MRRVHVGNIIVDSASFWIGDPMYGPLFGKTVVEHCAGERICRVSEHNRFMHHMEDGITGYTPDGDGEYPVYAEYDDDNVLLRVVLEFEEVFIP